MDSLDIHASTKHVPEQTPPLTELQRHGALNTVMLCDRIIYKGLSYVCYKASGYEGLMDIQHKTTAMEGLGGMLGREAAVSWMAYDM